MKNKFKQKLLGAVIVTSSLLSRLFLSKINAANNSESSPQFMGIFIENPDPYPYVKSLAIPVALLLGVIALIVVIVKKVFKKKIYKKKINQKK